MVGHESPNLPGARELTEAELRRWEETRHLRADQLADAFRVGALGTSAWGDPPGVTHLPLSLIHI